MDIQKFGQGSPALSAKQRETATALLKKSWTLNFQLRKSRSVFDESEDTEFYNQIIDLSKIRGGTDNG